MKPAFKCDYCDKIGTEEEIKEHEPKCFENYDRKSCYTCKHRGKMTMENSLVKYECETGRDIPAGHVFKFCKLYERKQKDKNPYSELTRSLFGNGFLNDF